MLLEKRGVRILLVQLIMMENVSLMEAKPCQGVLRTMEIVRSSNLELHHCLHERDADLENTESIT